MTKYRVGESVRILVHKLLKHKFSGEEAEAVMSHNSGWRTIKRVINENDGMGRGALYSTERYATECGIFYDNELEPGVNVERDGVEVD